MFPLPTFFTFPFTLPSLPSISLPANIQRRFLSYVLKRALGRFFRSGLDVDKIQSQISEGRVEIEGLVVDENEINSLIPASIPLVLTSGTVDKVHAQIPFPNLWSAPLTLSLDTLTLDFTIRPTSAPAFYKDKSPEYPFRPSLSSRQPTSPSVDLAASVTSAAGEFLHGELDAYEEAELDRSIRQSLILSRSDPFESENVPGAFPTSTVGPGGEETGEPLPATLESTTVLAGLVERILARLEVEVANVRLRIRHQSEGHHIELRIGQIRYADESATPTETAAPASTTRVVRISDIRVYMIPSSSVRQHSSNFSSRSSSTSTFSGSTDDGNMAMSLAVADLRQSMVSDIGSDASVYHSAISESSTTEPDHDSGAQRSRSSTPKAGPQGSEGTLILSFGTEDVVISIKTTRPPSIDLSGNSQRPGPTTGARPDPRRSRSSFSGGNLPSVEIDVAVGAITVLLVPSQMASLLTISQAVSGPAHPENASPDVGKAAQPKLEAKCRIKGIIVSAIYDMNADSDLASAMASYWTRPSSVYLPVGHLKLKLDSLEAAYAAKGHAPQQSPARPLVRRSSTTSTIRFGPRPPVATVRILDISIFEYIATDTTPASDSDDKIPGGAYPVLLFDAGLTKQYDHAPQGVYVPGHNAFPEFDAVDWRNSGLQKKSGGGEKAWKVRPKGRGVLKGVPGDIDASPVLVMKQDLSPGAPVITEAQPIHIFLDLSMVERLLPVLRHITPSAESSRTDRDSTPQQSPRHRLPNHFVIDDLDAQASSISTLQPTSGSQDLLVFKCPMVRLDIRCPAPPNRRGSWGDGAHLRSCIVTLDIHGLHAVAKRPMEMSGQRRGGQIKLEPKASVEWEKMYLFFCRVPDKKAAAFLAIGPLDPDPTDTDVLLPIVEVRSAMNPSQLIKTSTITCRIPSVQAKIRQRTIEGLQFFADDITHWLDGAFGDGSAPRPRDDLKMIGSRFFGSKGSSSSSAEEDEDVETTAATVLRLFVTEADIALHVPRHRESELGMEERILSLRGSDIDAKLESNTTGRQETALTLAILDAEFADRTDQSSMILSRTTPMSLTVNTAPLLQFRFSSLTHPQSGLKETGIKATVSSSTFFLHNEFSWAKDLALFAKTPEGVFEDVVPAEVTRIGISILDCSVHVKDIKSGGAIAIVVGTLEGKTDIESEAESRSVDVGIGNLVVMALDDLGAASELQGGYQSSVDAYSRAGYAQLTNLVAFELKVTQDLGESDELLVDVLQAQLKATACADSLATFGTLMGNIVSTFTPPKSPPREDVRSPVSLEHSVNVFDSIEENAFNRIPDIVSGADLIEDDLPTNLDYLDTATRPRQGVATDRSAGETLHSWQATHDDGSAEAGETIKILLDHFDVDEGYWDALPALTTDLADETRIGHLRVRVHNASASILLHEGYDWIRTRKAIEEEIKAVRRRLAKIRQLLASGQKADESLEQASTGSTLFNSVYIGLDKDQDGLDDTAALMAAIDDELEEGTTQTDMNTQSSWQTLPGAPGSSPNPQPFTSTYSADRKKASRLNGKRLTRSKKAQIEINLVDIKADLDVFDKAADMASRVHATIGQLEILDHIKTSTWKKFLTEMKADARGNMRETDADMVRVELVAVRPNLPSLAEESRLKAKILPLRLHVDQDALDFLKRFFSFSIPMTPSSPSEEPEQPVPPTPNKAPSTEPFFQHVEIYPIELKLDYKPKRVDFAALREGKTMELMNFFHFDGAEMTLRHITLSGVPGWERLSTNLQDAWTPDVKANQIADIVSGVSPIRSLVNVGSGVADLILLPIEQYRKDGRIGRGVQKGGHSFVRSTAMEMMKLGARLATGTQVVLEKAEGVLGGVRPVLPEVEVDEETLSRYANQPGSTREGIQAGYSSLSRNINSAAQTILAVPMEVYERSGDDGPLKAVVRAVPIAVLKPMIGASEAVSKTLLGMRNSLDPQGRKEQGDKYK